MTEFSQLRIKWDWLPAPEVRAPELRATWAGLEIYLGAQCLTLVEDVESSSSRRTIFVPLYPLAEWIAFNWWPLAVHSRPATTLARLGDYGEYFLAPTAKHDRARHGLRGAGDGFTWPNLLILPDGKTTRLCWRADPGSDGASPIRYLTSGDFILSGAEVQQRLGHLVDAVVIRLQSSGITDTLLQSEWRAVREMDNDEVAYCLAAARLGLDPYSDAEAHEEDILAAAHALAEPELLGDFLDVVEPAKILPALQWVTTTREEIGRLTSAARGFPPLRSEVRRLADAEATRWQPSRPWEIGWQQARLVREALSTGAEDSLRVEDLVPSVSRPGPTRNVYALGGLWKGADPLVGVAHEQRKPARRFTLARALWHLLWEDSSTFLITNAYTDRQKIERSFAAELLAPATGIAAKVEGDIERIDDDMTGELAENYEVSEMVIRHQVENQLLASGSTHRQT